MMKNARARRALHLHLVKRLLMGEELALSGHEELLLLFASLEIVLLLRRQCPTEAREGSLQRWDDTSTRVTGRKWTGLRWRAMRNTDLRDEERFARIADTPDQLTERLKIWVFDLLDSEIR
jgi:hypothetical protein